MNGYSLHPKVSIISQTSGKHHFFGYHDLCPWDVSEKYILAMETDFIDRPSRGPSAFGNYKADKAEICIIDTENNKLDRVAETQAWNFQQGSRLQWIPNKENWIIYNDRRDDGKSISVIVDVNTKKKIKELEYFIYTASPSRDVALGIDFRELVGGYTYALWGGEGGPAVEGINDPFFREKNTGILEIDLKTEEVLGPKLIIHTFDIAKKDHSPTPEEHHVLTHVTFNLSGSRICFIDKYKLPDGGFLQRLITANPDGTDPYVLPGHVSHYDWRNDTEILAYGKFSPTITALRGKGIFQNPILKPFLNMGRKMRGSLKQKIAGQSYMVFTDKTQNVKRIAVGRMTEDGHPQFSPNKKWVVTDSYPDKNHERTLILYDWENKKRIDIGKFSSLPKEFPNDWDVSEMRADLHPRWNRSGTAVCIDSVHEGTRQMYVLDVREITRAV